MGNLTICVCGVCKNACVCVCPVLECGSVRALVCMSPYFVLARLCVHYCARKCLRSLFAFVRGCLCLLGCALACMYTTIIICMCICVVCIFYVHRYAHIFSLAGYAQRRVRATGSGFQHLQQSLTQQGTDRREK